MISPELTIKKSMHYVFFFMKFSSSVQAKKKKKSKGTYVLKLKAAIADFIDRSIYTHVKEYSERKSQKKCVQKHITSSITKRSDLVTIKKKKCPVNQV